MYSAINYDKLIDVSGKAALITGGAAGIGKAIVKRLHEAGARVMIADINKETADSFAAELNQLRPASAISFALDVSQADQVELAFSYIIDQFGTIDILVNNAGIYPFSPLADMKEADFMKVIDVNLRSVFLFTKIVSDYMKTASIKGRIINVTSIDAIHPSLVGLAHYDASKHGEWGFTKNVARELAAFGITVNAIAPGAIATPGTGSLDGEVTPQLEPFLAQIPLKRMGHPDEIAKVTLFLASDMASYITGSQIVVDGGRLLS
jgi:2-deoxy-D-gluconate 3-dehydrogenase